jgi:hypothetical protein
MKKAAELKIRRITSLNPGAFMLHISLLEFPLLCMHLSLGSLQQQQQQTTGCFDIML